MSRLNLNAYDSAIIQLAEVIISQTADQEFDSFDDPAIERTESVEKALQNVRKAVAGFVWGFEGYATEKTRREAAMESVANDLASVERLAAISRYRLVCSRNIASADRCRAALASIGLRAANNAETLYHIELCDGSLPMDKAVYVAEFVTDARDAAEALNA